MGIESTGRQLKTVETTLEVIGALEELDGAGVTELADHLGLSKAAVHNHLSTLKANDFVVQVDREYKLGLRFTATGEYVKHQQPLYQAGKSEVDDLAERTGEYAHLMAEEHGRGYHLYKAQGDKAVAKAYHDLNLEKPYFLHHSAIGKAVLAYLPEERIEDVIDEYGLPAVTENTITSRDALYEELERTRERGYATNDEEEIHGLRAVGAPIRTSERGLVGAVSVSGPLSRMKGDIFQKEYPETVIQTANVIELNLETMRT